MKNRVKHREIYFRLSSSSLVNLSLNNSAKNSLGHTLVELACVLALLGTMLTVSFTSLSSTITNQNTSKAALIIEQELLVSQQLATLNQQTFSLKFNSSSVERSSQAGSKNLSKIIKLPRGINMLEANFGIYGNTIQFYKTGTVSPGRVSFGDKKGNFCSLKISLRGMIRPSCFFTKDKY